MYRHLAIMYRVYFATLIRFGNWVGFERYSSQIPQGGRVGSCFRLFSTVVILAATTAMAAPPLYVVGSIPPLEVKQNALLALQLQSPKPGVATFSYSVNPGYPPP